MLIAGSLSVFAAPANPLKNTFCNPLNLNYNFWKTYREAADPCIIIYKNEYYLFASHSGGYWWSKDMADWQFVTPTGIDIAKFAPATVVIGDTMFYTSSEDGDIYKSGNPKAGIWTTVGHPATWQDPCLFKDDDGKMYCYHGCTANGNINVVELNPTGKWPAIGTSSICFSSNRTSHGFEVVGENNENLTGDSWIEGAWMTKYKSKYYLQYSVPGTEFRSYSDGCYTANAAKGPFTFCQNSPVSFRPRGFVTGIGHSCTYQDLLGKYWHISTSTVSVLANFERRLAIFPAAFDNDSLLHVDSYLGDYPQYLPGFALQNATDNRANCMLLSFEKAASASSTLTGCPVKNAFDENIRTWWSATSANVGEWLLVDLGKNCDIAAIQTNFAEQGTTYAGGRGTSFSYKYKIEGALDTFGTWSTLVNKTTNTKDLPHDYVILDSVVTMRFIRIVNAGSVPGAGLFAVRDLRVFGQASCSAPAAVSSFTVNRNSTDKRMATISWNRVTDAEGYNVRVGISPEKLYNSYQMLGTDSTTCIMRSLNLGTTYYFAIDAYSSCGLTKGIVVKRDDNSSIATSVTMHYVPIIKHNDNSQFIMHGGNASLLPLNKYDPLTMVTVFDISGRILLKNNIANLQKWWKKAQTSNRMYIFKINTNLQMQR